MRQFLFTLLLLWSTFPLSAQPKQEVRAAWVTSLYGLDWPQTRAVNAQTIRKQKEELIAILDKLKAAHFNTVLFQARPRGDALYPSSIEPFNVILTGTTGKNPGYDPLAFAIEECHKRGMECHAWMVTIPLGNRKHVASLGNRSVTKRKKEICIRYKNEYFLNPGHPETKKYLMSLVDEIVRRYDIDGVHFDYLRYPEHAFRFPDEYDFRRYGKGRTLNQWRRDNITEIARYLYKGVKNIKPWVKVSACPVGKYRDTSRYPSRGWNAYHTVHQDPQGWLGEGIVDQLYPMMYFQGNSFYPFALDWQEQSNGRHIIPGLGIYFLHPDEGKWTRDEIDRQMYFLRHHGLAGEAFYRVKYLMENTQGVYDELCHTFYTCPALQPSMPWLDSVAPSVPKNLKKTLLRSGYAELTWQAATDNDSRNAPMYVIYASDEYPVDTSRPENIVAQRITATRFLYAPLLPWNARKYVAVTAIDRYGNESEAVQEELTNTSAPAYSSVHASSAQAQ